MFDKNKQNNELIQQLKDKNLELETLLNQVANDNGSIIVKQLPNGKIELNGIEMDNTSEVEYYNSSQATYGELTMFRIGKEAKQREMDKLVKTHMNEIDNLNNKILKLQDNIAILENKSQTDINTIKTLETNINNLKIQLDKQFKVVDDIIKSNQTEKQELIKRYEGMISGLEEDIRNWKQRYLTINNVTIEGTIITKYGKILEN